MNEEELPGHSVRWVHEYLVETSPKRVRQTIAQIVPYELDALISCKSADERKQHPVSVKDSDSLPRLGLRHRHAEHVVIAEQKYVQRPLTQKA